MKDIIRVKSLLSTDIENLLNQQIKKEAHSSSLYLSMSSWCDQNGFDYSADYFLKQSFAKEHHSTNSQAGKPQLGFLKKQRQ